MKIKYGSQTINKEDIKRATKVFGSEYLTQGPEVINFENNLKKKFGSKYCSVVSSGTAALHLAVMSLSLGKNSKIITTPMTFVATSNSIIMNNLIPEFVDIDINSYTIDLNKLEHKLKKDKKIKAAIGIDYAGNICDWESLGYLAKKYKIKLINDNCHAIGTRYKGKTNYACQYADIVTQSYHPVKAITTAEGGSILTNNKKIYEKVSKLRSHGINRSLQLQKKHGPWYYAIDELGYNYRLTDIQSALGINQLKKLDKFISYRRSLAKIYDSEFKNIKEFKIPKSRENCYHSYHLYPLLIDFKKFKINKKDFFVKMQKIGIFMQVHYLPIHYHNYYRKKFNLRKGDFPVSEDFYNKEVSLPIYPSLKKKQIFKVIHNLKKILSI